MGFIRTSLDQLEADAHAEAVRTGQPCEVEYDRFENIAVLLLGGITYIAALPPAVAS